MSEIIENVEDRAERFEETMDSMDQTDNHIYLLLGIITDLRSEIRTLKSKLATAEQQVHDLRSAAMAKEAC